MRLRDRLSSLSSPSGAPSAPEPFAIEHEDPERARRISQLRTLIGDIEQRAREGRPRTHEHAARSPQALPFGVQRQTAEGPLHVVERWFEPDHCHGRVAVRDALRTQPALLARLALEPAFEQIDLSRMLILDTETTGLAGGTGT